MIDANYRISKPFVMINYASKLNAGFWLELKDFHLPFSCWFAYYRKDDFRGTKGITSCRNKWTYDYGGIGGESFFLKKSIIDHKKL